MSRRRASPGTRTVAVWLLAVLLTPFVGAAADPTADGWAAGEWEGGIEEGGTTLPVLLSLAAEGDAWRGTLDLPAEGAADLRLENVVVTPSTVGFEIAGAPGRPRFEGRREGDRIAGIFQKTGVRLPFALQRRAPAAKADPRVSEEVVVEGGGIRLAATVTWPADLPPRAAVVLISGSGAQDRDAETMGLRPFRDLAARLAVEGIASLRADDRGVGGSSGDLAAATTPDLAEDAARLTRYLAARPELGGAPTGIVGHSEGATVATLAALDVDEAAFVVLLAGPGVPGRALLPEQARRVAAARGVEPGRVEARVGILEQALRLVESEPEPSTRRAELMDLVREQLEAAGSGLPPGPNPLLENEVGRLLSPWFRHFLVYDPAPALARLEVPALAVHGSLDLQVPGDQSLPAIERALATNEMAAVVELPGLNHLLQRAETGSPSEYYRLGEGLAPEAMETIVRWILERSSVPG